MPSAPINISNDVTIGFSGHDVLELPSPVPKINFSIELPGNMYWPPGLALNKLSMTSTVQHKMMDIVLDGHDQGPLLLHITLPTFANPLLAVIIPLSSRKVKFSTSIVKMDKKNVGCAVFYFPMQGCGDPVSVPVSFPLFNLMNTVSVGILWTDIGIGILDILLSMGIDFVFHKFFKGPAKSPGKILRERIKNRLKTFTQIAGEQLFARMKSDLLPNSAKAWAKKGLSSLSGLLVSSLKGDPTFKIGTGNDWLGGEVGWSRSKGFGGEAHGGGLQGGAGSQESQAWGSPFPPSL